MDCERINRNLYLAMKVVGVSRNIARRYQPPELYEGERLVVGSECLDNDLMQLALSGPDSVTEESPGARASCTGG